MRGCPGSSVRDSSASWARSADALLADAADHLIIGDVGNLADAALAQHVAHQLAPWPRRRPGGAGGGKLIGEIAELLRGDETLFVPTSRPD